MYCYAIKPEGQNLLYFSDNLARETANFRRERTPSQGAPKEDVVGPLQRGHRGQGLRTSDSQAAKDHFDTKISDNRSDNNKLTILTILNNFSLL